MLPAFAAPEAGGGGPGEAAAAENPEGAGGGGGGVAAGAADSAAIAAPWSTPASYTVTLTLAGKTETTTVTVEDDPRLSVSPDDRTKRRTAITKLFTMTRQADEGRRKIVAMNTALTALTDSWKRPAAPPVPDAVKKAADDIAGQDQGRSRRPSKAPPAAAAEPAAAPARHRPTRLRP